MGQETAIEWCHHTFNPWRGCAKVHAGCTRCYAENNIGVKMQGIRWGEVWQAGQRVVAAESSWKQPLTWARAAARAGERHRVFCASLADVLEVPTYPPPGQRTTELAASVAAAQRILDEARERLWATIRSTAQACQVCGLTPDGPCEHQDALGDGDWPGLDWLALTKRPENGYLVPEDVRSLIWLGTSVSDQKTADEWVPRLLKAEGFRLCFLSVEPLVGPVDLSRWLGAKHTTNEHGECVHWCERCRRRHVDGLPLDAELSWVIVGGESGPGARPCAVEWVRDIVRQCREAGVPCLVKQLGAMPVMSEALWREQNPAPPLNAKRRDRIPDGAVPLALVDPKGGDLDEWPDDLRVRQYPHPPA